MHFAKKIDAMGKNKCDFRSQRPKIRQNTLSSSFEGYPLQVRHKQDWGREFILLSGVSPSQQAWNRSRAQKYGAWKRFHSTPFPLVPFVICPFRGADAKSGKVVQKIPCSCHKRASGS